MIVDGIVVERLSHVAWKTLHPVCSSWRQVLAIGVLTRHCVLLCVLVVVIVVVVDVVYDDDVVVLETGKRSDLRKRRRAIRRIRRGLYVGWAEVVGSRWLRVSFALTLSKKRSCGGRRGRVLIFAGCLTFFFFFLLLGDWVDIWSWSGSGKKIRFWDSRLLGRMALC